MLESKTRKTEIFSKSMYTSNKTQNRYVQKQVRHLKSVTVHNNKSHKHMSCNYEPQTNYAPVSMSCLYHISGYLNKSQVQSYITLALDKFHFLCQLQSCFIMRTHLNYFHHILLLYRLLFFRCNAKDDVFSCNETDNSLKDIYNPSFLSCV